MRKISLLCLLVISLFVFTGCTPRTIVKTKLLTPDDVLIADCYVTPPPDKDTYIYSTTENQKKMLVDYSRELIKDNAKCNQQFKALRDWKIKSQAEVDKLNKKE